LDPELNSVDNSPVIDVKRSDKNTRAFCDEGMGRDGKQKPSKIISV
jgi:hypothetical protein